MAVSEVIMNRRDNLVDWLKPALKVIPVSIYGEEDNVYIRFQELLICGVQVGEETYRIYNVTDDWKEKTTCHCELADDGTWFYYVDDFDACIGECKRLVMFEATKNSKKAEPRGGQDEPLVSDYWLNETRELLKGITNFADFIVQKGVKKGKFQCYGTGPRNRMQVWLNPPTSRNPEFFSVWIGEEVLPPSMVKTDVGDKKVHDRNGFQECHIKFPLSTGANRLKDIEAGFEFVREIRRLVEG